MQDSQSGWTKYLVPCLSCVMQKQILIRDTQITIAPSVDKGWIVIWTNISWPLFGFRSWLPWLSQGKCYFGLTSVWKYEPSCFCGTQLNYWFVERCDWDAMHALCTSVHKGKMIRIHKTDLGCFHDCLLEDEPLLKARGSRVNILSPVSTKLRKGVLCNGGQIQIRIWILVLDLSFFNGADMGLLRTCLAKRSTNHCRTVIKSAVCVCACGGYYFLWKKWSSWIVTTIPPLPTHIINGWPCN